MSDVSVFLRRFHRFTRYTQAQLTRVVVIAATGDRSHALTRTTLDIELLEHCLGFFRRHASHVDTRQCRVEGLLLHRLRTPNRKSEDEATGCQNRAHADHERESSLSIDLLQARATTSHFSLYSMRGEPAKL